MGRWQKSRGESDPAGPGFTIQDGVLKCTPASFIQKIIPITNMGREGKIQSVLISDGPSLLTATLFFTSTPDPSLPPYTRQQLEGTGLGYVLNKSPQIRLVMKDGAIGYIVKGEEPNPDAQLISQNVSYPKLDFHKLKVSDVTGMWGKNDPEGSRVQTLCPEPNSAVMLTYCNFDVARLWHPASKIAVAGNVPSAKELEKLLCQNDNWRRRTNGLDGIVYEGKPLELAVDPLRSGRRTRLGIVTHPDYVLSPARRGPAG